MLNVLCCLPPSPLPSVRAWDAGDLTPLTPTWWTISISAKTGAGFFKRRLQRTPIQTGSGCPRLLHLVEESEGSVVGQGWVVGLDGNGNGQNHYKALYSFQLYHLTILSRTKWPPSLHSHLQAGAEISGCQSGRHSSSDGVCSLSRNTKGVSGGLCPSPQPQQGTSQHLYTIVGRVEGYDGRLLSTGIKESWSPPKLSNGTSGAKCFLKINTRIFGKNLVKGDMLCSFSGTFFT